MQQKKPSKFSRTREKTNRARDLRKTVSRTEFKLWPYLRKKNLGYSFRRQHPIGPYFADYYCAALKLAVEVDGDWHDEKKDTTRDAFFQNKGIKTHRIWVSDMDENIEGAVQGISSIIAERKLELNLTDYPLACLQKKAALTPQS